jgi:choline dehydrogenase-like flavoprotein
VREITVDRKGRAQGALYYDVNGMLQQVEARIVVMACNGVGTPRLLLNSTSRHFPDGLANRNGIVGRNLMFHPVAAVAAVFEQPLDSSRGPIGSILYSHEFYETDERRGFVRGYSLQAVRQSGPLHAALGGFVSQPIPWGEGHHRVFQERFGHIANLGVMAEDLPDEHNRVTLDPNLVDGNGVPAPKVSYRLSENSARMLEHGIARAREALEAAGAKEVLVDPLMRPSGWHLLGTARMGDDPRKSVVNRWGATHDVPNLFVIDGSIFTTSAAVNPPSTIQALALRSADYLLANRHSFS